MKALIKSSPKAWGSFRTTNGTPNKYTHEADGIDEVIQRVCALWELAAREHTEEHIIIDIRLD